MRLVSILCLLIASVADASPDAGEIQLAIDPNHQTIEATLIGAPNVPLERIELVQLEPRAIVKAQKKRDYAAGAEAIAVALVVNGQEIYMGNDDIEPEDSPSRYPGVLKGFAKALDARPLDKLGPPSSTGVLVTFSVGASILQPMGPLANLTSKSLGDQRAYYRKIGMDLVPGVELALSELGKSTAPRKAMIVLSDGNDTNNETAKAALQQLKKAAARDGVQIFAIVYKGQLSDAQSVIGALTTHTIQATSSETFTSALGTIAEYIGDRYSVTFPGTGLAWDGKSHALAVKIGDVQTDPVTVVLPAAPASAATPATLVPVEPQKHGCGGCGSIAIVGLVGFRRRRVAV